MSFDDDFDDPVDDYSGFRNLHNDFESHSPADESGASQTVFDPMDIKDPASAFFFLGDDAQDEIVGSNKKKMRCRSCQHHFRGEIFDSCPKCHSFDTEEMIGEIDY